MQTRVQLIYNDICTVGILGCVIYRWGRELQNFWFFLLVYFLIKQLMAHKEYYKENNRLF